MSEQPISISCLNDFVFCPVSIYFHALDCETDNISMKDTCQINGTAAHEKSDNAEYSSKKSMFQGISIYSGTYDLYGKIDTFDSENGVLTERKKQIKAVYDGYVFQLYAQYYALREMGFEIKKMRLYSLADNKAYPIELPENNPQMAEKFKALVAEMREFRMEGFVQKNTSKCLNCIYEPLCSFSLLK